MPGLVDIHAHVLPGVDDGPENLEQAVVMARAAVRSGILTMAATPHLRADFPNVNVRELAVRCGLLQKTLRKCSVDLQLVSGAEVALNWALESDDESLRLASYGQLGSHLLIETPSGFHGALDGLLSRVQTRGYRVVLAHPERSTVFQREPAQLEELVDRGILLEVNANSLEGRSPRHKLARRLVTNALAHVIASDAHRGVEWRPVTELARAREAAVALVGEARADWMMRRVPEAILAGGELPPPPALQLRRRLPRLFS